MSVSTEKSTVDSPVPLNTQEIDEPGAAPEALFYVLPYLHLRELIAIETSNRQLRNAIIGDVLLWQHLHVYPPLNKKFTDVELLRLTTRAQGRLQSLELLNCTRVTEESVETAVASNPLLEKLGLPGCTNVTPEGIVGMVKTLTEGRSPDVPKFTQLRIRGIYGITSEVLDDINGMMRSTGNDLNPKAGNDLNPKAGHDPNPKAGHDLNPKAGKVLNPKALQYYKNGGPASAVEEKRSVDVEVCPKCATARMVYDCTRVACQLRSEIPLQQCKGCYLCIARCEECGGCVDGDDVEETFCLEVLCQRCWLRLPKCSECNRAGCSRHAPVLDVSGAGSFTCESCQGVSLSETGSEFD